MEIYGSNFNLCFLLLSLSALEVCLYLRDQTVIHVLLDDGHLAQADDLFEIVKEEQQLPSNANSIFSLWLVSPLLGKYP